MAFRDAVSLAQRLHGKVWGTKANDLLDGSHSPSEVISCLKEHGHVFADIKAHDIPATVANRVRRLAKAGADLITVHGSGGIEMIKAAVDAFHSSSDGGVGILVVTALTSLTDDNCTEIYGARPMVLIPQFAKFAEKAGAFGVVCSPKELSLLTGTTLKRVTPGVRSPGAETHDQARVDTPKNALRKGADFLVIGRQVTGSSDPVAEVERINQEITQS
jgi:orotidine-5'-phosphate decarboxylase